MSRRGLRILFCFLFSSLVCVANGCSGGAGASAPDAAIDAPADLAAPDAAGHDVPATDLVETDTRPAPDLVVVPDTAPDLAEPDTWIAPKPFSVGVAEGLLQAPLGMGVAGYGPAPPQGHVSPFAQIYAATDRVFSPLTAKVIALEAGYRRLAIVRLDVIAVVKELRRGVALILAQRGVPIAEDDLLMAATHTHAAPARILNKTLWFALADIFWPQHYERMLGSIADVVEAALADLEPGRFGAAVGYTEEAQFDRRCANPALLDGTLPVLRFERADGTPKAAIVVYAIHGTVLNNTDYAYSSDSGGAIEYKVAERFDSPVEVMFLNAWAGDVRPGDPRGAPPDDPLPVIEGVADQLEAIGNAVADEALRVWDTIETTEAVEVDYLSALVALNHEAMGYEMSDFPYPYGGVYCGANLDGACAGSGDPLPDRDALIRSCGMFGSAEQGITSTVLSVFRIGDVLLPTFPGEAVTQIGRNVVEGIRAETGWEGAIAFVGYAQDYTGYSETEEYWWYGDYETSGGTWGPRQGDYLAAEAIALAARFLDPERPLAVHPAEDFTILEVPPNSPLNVVWEAEDSVAAGTVAEEPDAELVSGATARVVWTGGDPWIDHPHIWLERRDDVSGEWLPFLRQNGTVVANDAYEFTLGLLPEPAYTQTVGHTARTFYWWAEMPTARIQPTTTVEMRGTFRFRVGGRYGADGEALPYDATSRSFAVGPAAAE